MRRFFIKQSETAGPISVVRGTDARHIKKVLRLKQGDIITLFDGAGNEYEARIISLSPSSVNVSIIRTFPSTTESPVQIIVAQAFLKQRKMDNLVRQLTELGITKWVPFISKRSVPRPDNKRLADRINRWKKISKEALKQCNRGRIMEIGPTVSFEDTFNISRQSSLKIAFWENESKPINLALSRSDRPFNNIFIMIGPEGGFTSQEIEKAKACGFITATLGPRILRAETAAIAASVLIQYLFGDIGIKNS
ncbi:MAG: 16S rRNA (uracil(1498)-N(3))-methyltransferase [Desulfobacterales bacterium]|uniref:Ribosomal RNA small subunit methyltransferase E n=1 Tax=Candidatus Desulfaltia bathyphila TaxID=2841697 RepID=A0A8J6T691_9BACT|nr:16S rRNA (uracil(1498)-N(3))-methyltransferase [Candidatus Desulfaltia bathyphila]MBL7195928.1 16S rRNA (uracil(1498)-N(3))-methyltransferase [Desulfobacterales bacterium]MBL7207509.1 16S rRNA (uracil(1498)-N(3))-methyltransferase [Desulfobacterales bacterium]